MVKCRKCGRPIRRYKATYGMYSHAEPIWDGDHEPVPEGAREVDELVNEPPAQLHAFNAALASAFGVQRAG